MLAVDLKRSPLFGPFEGALLDFFQLRFRLRTDFQYTELNSGGSSLTRNTISILSDNMNLSPSFISFRFAFPFECVTLREVSQVFS